MQIYMETKVCEFTWSPKEKASSKRRVLLVLDLTGHIQARAQGSHKEKKPKEAARTDPVSNPRGMH